MSRDEPRDVPRVMKGATRPREPGLGPKNSCRLERDKKVVRFALLYPKYKVRCQACDGNSRAAC